MPTTAFQAAAAYLSSAPSLAKVPNATKLEIYALFKLVTIGPTPNTSRPSIFDMTGRAKWDAWDGARKKYSAQEAEARYLDIAKELGWNENETSQKQVQSEASIKGKAKEVQKGGAEGEEGDIWDSEEDAANANGGGGLGGSVSTMAYTKEESEKTLHGFAVENDVEGIEELMRIVPDLDLNEVDEHGYTPLHLAADRGHLDVVRLLLSKGVDRSIKDPDDMTALELARTVGHKEIVLVLSN